MTLLWILAFGLLGLFVGSFLNVCIDRLPQNQSIAAPPSHCSECNHKLAAIDLIPVVSYLFLRGHCRYCQARIPFRIPIVEGITGLLFGFLYWKTGLGLDLAIFLIYACFLIVIFFIDLEKQLVLDKVTYPAMAIALILSYFWPSTTTFTMHWPGIGVLSALLGGVTGAAIYILIILLCLLIIHQEGMGRGDVKMAALIGLMVGFPLLIEALLISWIIGGIVAAILIVLKLKGRKDIIPSATFLAIAAMVTLVYGQAIFNWYVPV